MSSTRHTDRNIAARMGRWSAGHWKTATFGWLAFVLVAFGLGGAVGTRNIESSEGPGESGRMNKILEAGFEQPANEHVLIQSGSLRVGTTAFDAAITDLSLIGRGAVLGGPTTGIAVEAGRLGTTTRIG